MSKWRPSKPCVYVIADVHGKYEQLKTIFNRVLPLRKTGGVHDQLIMLGDYIDRHTDSHKVLDLLIKTKNKYDEQLVLLRGNHEIMLLDAIASSLSTSTSSSSDDFLMWMKNGGEQTLSGYLQRADLPSENPYTFSRFRLPNVIPKEHINFITDKMVDTYQLDEYIFAHAGYNPYVIEQDTEDVWWGGNLYNKVRNLAAQGKTPDWDKTIVVGHYWKGPFIIDKFMMLDRSFYKEILVTEINSMQAYIARANKSKLVKYKLEKFSKNQAKPMFLGSSN